MKLKLKIFPFCSWIIEKTKLRFLLSTLRLNFIDTCTCIYCIVCIQDTGHAWFWLFKIPLVTLNMWQISIILVSLHHHIWNLFSIHLWPWKIIFFLFILIHNNMLVPWFQNIDIDFQVQSFVPTTLSGEWWLHKLKNQYLNCRQTDTRR